MPSTIVRSVCPHNCPDCCGMLTTVENGKAVRVAGDPEHPYTRGWLCTRGNHYLERVYHPDRLLHPLQRTGPKGSGQFKAITWDEALRTIANRWQEIIGKWGAEAILPYSYSGTLGVVQGASIERRFFNRLGASRLERSICSVAGGRGIGYTIGAAAGTDPEDFVNSKLILIWGTNPASTGPHIVPFVQEARRRGAKVVLIDPRRSQTAPFADYVVQPLPGTDAALALAIMQVLIDERLIDADFVAAHTLGYESLAERAAEYPPERAAAICGVPPDQIEELARLYGTVKPAVIRVGPGMQRQLNGGMAIRSIACLPALTGQYGRSGGGFLYATSGHLDWDLAVLHHELPGENRPRTINMNRLGEALLAADPPVRSLYVFNSNPRAIAPAQRKVEAGLLREDLFTVVHELFPTDSVDYADIVLPATSQLEQEDLHKAYGHLYLRLNRQAIQPLGESKTNLEVFHLLSEQFGFTEPWLHATPEEVIRGVLSGDQPGLSGITYERLLEEPAVRINTPQIPAVPFADGRFPTPSGKVEFWSARLQQDGFDPLPVHVPLEARGAEYGEGMLALVTPGSHHFLNSSFANLPRFRQIEEAPTLELHPDDAAQRGLGTGDWARVSNSRGSCMLRVKVANSTRPGVAVSTTVWWQKHSPERRNVNYTTPDDLADMGNNSTFHSNFVSIEKMERAPTGWEEIRE